MGRYLLNSRRQISLKCFSAFRSYVCAVTWKLAARLKSRFDMCDDLVEMADLDVSMAIG